MDIEKIKESLKPKLKFKELPGCIQTEMIKMLFIGSLFLLFGIIYSVTTFKIEILLYLIPLLLLYILICAFWCYRFFYDKILIIDGTIIDIQCEDNKLRNKLRAKFFQFVSLKYEIVTRDGYEISVVKTSHKIREKGSKIRLYTAPDNIYERPGKRPIINTVYYTEILELPKRKK